jgi:hypothetical protein
VTTVQAGSPVLDSYLLNGDFAIAQVQLVRTTLASYANNSYFADQWYFQHDTGGTNIQFRNYVIGDGSEPVAYPSATAYGEIKNNSGGAAGALWLQPVEAREAAKLRGKNVVFSVNARCTATETLKVVVYEWTGTVDSASVKSLVASWSSNVPTFNTTTLTQVATGSASIGTGGWTQVTATGAVSTSCNTLIVACWVEGLNNAASVYVSEAGLYEGQSPKPYRTRPDELQLCLRHLHAFGGSTFSVVGDGFAFANNGFFAVTPLSVPLRKAPTLVATAADWQVFNSNLGTTLATATVGLATTADSTVPRDRVQFSNTVAGTPYTAGQAVLFRANNNAAALLLLDSRL